MEVHFVASEGAGFHGTLYIGYIADRKTTVRDRSKQTGKGILTKMLTDLEIDRNEF